jgi:hypothetical protein
MRRAVTWRQRMAQWLYPAASETSAPRVIEARSRVQEDRAPDVWPAICEQFALRILAAAYQMGSHLEAAETDEQDPDRLEKLYRIDHANTRLRRQAENLQVLVGRQVDDADRQVTPLLDVARASASAIEHYPRVHIGQMVDLAVVEFAADDIIRVLTELLDNATRFSPPTSTVIVSAYLTERGSVLVRVEDAGVGIPPTQLPLLNAVLSGNAAPPLGANPAAHLGLIVVRRLALAHRLRVQLTSRQSGGTTATVLIPDGLICEIPLAARSAPAPAAASPARVTRTTHRPVAPGAAHPRAGAPGQVSHLMLVDDRPPAGHQPRRNAGAAGNGLPRRVPTSLRGESPHGAGGTGEPPGQREPAVSAHPEVHRQAWPDETADFAAGISDARRPANQSSGGYPQ